MPKYNREARGIRGAGDLVAWIAQPVAGAIDATFGTNVKHCNACQKRREFLNKLLPMNVDAKENK